MYKVPLTQNQVSLVDDIDAEAVLAVGEWCYTRSKYACHYWRDSAGKRHTLFLHRFIYSRMLGHAIPPGLQIDHESAREQGKAARLDNQRANLRLATPSQNQAAKGNQKNSSTVHKGITLRSHKYDVRLRFHHHRLHLGRYTDFEQALAVYQYAHRILWQEFTSEGQEEVSLSAAVQEKVDEQIATVLKAVSPL